MMGDVRAASESLIGRLEPAAAGVIGAELQRVSRLVLLLQQAAAREQEKLQAGELPEPPRWAGASDAVGFLCLQEQQEPFPAGGAGVEEQRANPETSLRGTKVGRTTSQPITSQQRLASTLTAT